MAYHKWQPIFTECESSLGFSGDAANDVYSAWSRLATDAFQKRSSYLERGKSSPQARPRRSNSLTRLQGRKTVKVPVQLIPLERARALTAGQLYKDEIKKRTSTYIGSTITENSTVAVDKPEISRPLNLEESTLCCSYPSGMSYRISLNPYAPQADFSTTPPNDFSDESKHKHLDSEKEETDISQSVESSTYSEDLGSTIQAYVDKVRKKENR